MAWGLVDSRNENPICYEHNKTRDNYPYYNPFLDENLFGIETKYDNFYDSFIDKDMSLKDKLNAIRNLKNVEINIEDLFID